MINRILSRVRMPRFVEVLLGVLLVVVLCARYSDAQEPGRFLLEFVLPYKPLFLIASLFLWLLAARLIAGAPKDYSGYFYRLLSRFFGDPGKKAAER